MIGAKHVTGDWRTWLASRWDGAGKPHLAKCAIVSSRPAASSGLERAPGLHPGGQRFESFTADHFIGERSPMRTPTLLAGGLIGKGDGGGEKILDSITHGCHSTERTCPQSCIFELEKVAHQIED